MATREKKHKLWRQAESEVPNVGGGHHKDHVHTPEQTDKPVKGHKHNDIERKNPMKTNTSSIITGFSSLILVFAAVGVLNANPIVDKVGVRVAPVVQVVDQKVVNVDNSVDPDQIWVANVVEKVGYVGTSKMVANWKSNAVVNPVASVNEEVGDAVVGGVAWNVVDQG